MTDLGMLYKKLLAVYRELGRYEQYLNEYDQIGDVLDKIWWDLPEKDRDSLKKRIT